MHRVRVIAAFQTSGVPLDALIAGAEAGHVRLGAYDQLHESLGPGSDRSYGAFRAAVDPDGERLTELYTALGLAEPRDGTHLPVADYVTAEAAATLTMDGLDVRPAGRLAIQGVGEVEVAQLERRASG